MNGLRSIFVVLIIFILAFLGGCHDPVPLPAYMFNPNPIDNYIITMHSNKLIPSDVYANIQYEIRNRKCIPVDYTKAIGGIRPNPHPVIRVNPVHDKSKSIYFIVSNDMILPSDYWGIGVCRWRIDGIDVKIKHKDRYFNIWRSGPPPYKADTVSCNYEKDRDKRLNSCWRLGENITDHMVVNKGSFVYHIATKEFDRESIN